MGRIYTAAFNGTHPGQGFLGKNLFEITAATNKPVTLRGWSISKVVVDPSMVIEELMQIDLLKITSGYAAGTGGTTVTPVPMDSADVAAGCSMLVHTTGTGSSVIQRMLWGGWNPRGPTIRWFERPAFKIHQGEALLARRLTPVIFDIEVSYTLWLEEE